MIDTLYSILEEIRIQKTKPLKGNTGEYEWLLRKEAAIKEAIFRLENNCLDK